uniref:Uncharacterized protein n=1 Tax=Arundo donax TaxID=35708 RepID=A0A0A9HV91_ARUDO
MWDNELCLGNVGMHTNI